LNASGLPQRQDEGFLQQHKPEEDTLCTTRGLPRTIRALVHAVEVTRVNAYPDTILPLMVPGLGGGERSIQVREMIIWTPSNR